MALISRAMPRSIEASFEANVTVEQVHAAFGNRDYWLSRIAAFDPGITLDSFCRDPDGAVTVTTTQDLRHEALPGPLARVYPGELGIYRYEAWTPIEDRKVTGDIKVTATGVPLSGSGTALLSATGRGSRLTFAGSVQLSLPLVGGRIESHLAGQLAQGIADILRFTTGWIGEHSTDRTYP
jgi:Protein of unknown function (DUF2505)